MKKLILQTACAAAIAALLCVTCGEPGGSPNPQGVADGFNNTFLCAANPTAYGCYGYCTANPSAYGCPGYCTANPNAEGCHTDVCLTNPAPSCANYCQFYPTAAGCGYTDPCVSSPGSQACCASNPNYSGCTSNPTVYTVTFNPNGGTVSPTSGTTGADGRLASLPAPARSGYTFNGWYTAATGGAQVTAGTVFTAHTIIYAQWTAVSTSTYTVTLYDSYYGMTLDVKAVTSGGGIYLPDATDYITRSGYRFIYWSTGTGTTYNAGLFYTPAGDVTLYAQWEYISTTYTITFNANGGTVSPASGTTGANGRLASLPTPARSNYTFNGWYTAATGGTQVTTSTVFNGSTTIYARWTAVSQSTYYCQWGGAQGCVELGIPDAIDPNNTQGLTNLENCEINSFGLSTSPTCAGIAVSTTAYYCNWGPWDNVSKQGGCWWMRRPDAPNYDPTGLSVGSITFMESCKEYGKLITCTGSDRPIDGTCCVGN